MVMLLPIVCRFGVNDEFCTGCRMAAQDAYEGYVSSWHWTGRPADAGTPLQLLRDAVRLWVRNRLYPYIWCDKVCPLATSPQNVPGECVCEWEGYVAPGIRAGPVRLWLRSQAWERWGIEGATGQAVGC